MIEKMKFLSITGPRPDIDRITQLYLSKYEIQLEPAMSELKTVDNLHPFVETNPYKEYLEKVTHYVTHLKNPPTVTDISLSIDDIFVTVHLTDKRYHSLQEKINDLKTKREELRRNLKLLIPFTPWDFNLHQVIEFRYIKYRFGRISIPYYQRLESFLARDNNVAVFVESSRDSTYVYGAYFVSPDQELQTDAIFKSLHFERFRLPDIYDGSLVDARTSLELEIESLTQKILDLDSEVSLLFEQSAKELIIAQNTLSDLTQHFDVRKLAARVQNKNDDYYILCGWMPQKEVTPFLEAIKDDNNIFAFLEEEEDTHFTDPPTKLKNPKLFKPFEMFIHMYGLPKYNEMDPTIFVALTYAFLFGAMFGDVGQGLCLIIGGFLLYRFKGIALAGVLAAAGVFSTFFGFMFGSVFGFEGLLFEPIWLSPAHHMSTLPFVGRLNTVFIVSVILGMALNLLLMIFHIINAIRAKDIDSLLFDSNGFAGFIFYASVIASLILFMTGHILPGSLTLIIIFGLPLLMIGLKEPLTALITKKHEESESGILMSAVQIFFELFEILLTYLSNTLSFIRVGAFAVSHAAMMSVVLMLAGAQHGITSDTNWVVIVLGNILVCAIEGLIVGIQVLRLEYYELFSRFYKGSGRAFVPYAKTKK